MELQRGDILSDYDRWMKSYYRLLRNKDLADNTFLTATKTLIISVLKAFFLYVSEKNQDGDGTWTYVNEFISKMTFDISDQLSIEASGYLRGLGRQIELVVQTFIFQSKIFLISSG